MRACVDAMRMSIGSVMVTPTPTAAPLIAAITGFLSLKISSVSSPPPSRCFSACAAPSRLRSKVDGPRPRSAPAQKRAPGAGDDDDADRVVGVGAVEGVDHLVAHDAGERVEMVGTVHREQQRRAVHVVADLFVFGHGSLLFARRCGIATGVEGLVDQRRAVSSAGSPGTG